MLCMIFAIMLIHVPGLFCNSEMDYYSDLDDEGSGLELVHVSDVLDYLGGFYSKIYEKNLNLLERHFTVYNTHTLS